MQFAADPDGLSLKLWIQNVNLRVRDGAADRKQMRNLATRFNGLRLIGRCNHAGLGRAIGVDPADAVACELAPGRESYR